MRKGGIKCMNQGLISCLPLLTLIAGVLLTKRMTESLLVSSLMGFRKSMERVCATPSKTLFFTWLLGAIIFIDDYLNALAVSVSMKGISDRQKIPREHLAYTVNCMGACVCVMIPVSSWSAFSIGCLGEYHLTAADYYRAIPLMFYPICAILICLLLGTGKFPKLGKIRSAYQRVEKGGDMLEAAKSAGNLISMDLEQKGPLCERPVRYFLIPMAVLFAGTIFSGNDIMIGLLLALAVMLVMYRAGNIFTVEESVKLFLKGVESMAGLLFNIAMAFMIQAACEKMGFADYVIGNFIRMMAPQWIPVTAFLIVGGMAFLAASFWTLIVITFPVFIPMAVQVGINPSLVIAAVMSGVALGSQACVYSDAVFMVAAGTGVTNDVQFRTVLPYVGIGAGIVSVLFLMAGYCYF